MLLDRQKANFLEFTGIQSFGLALCALIALARTLHPNRGRSQTQIPTRHSLSGSESRRPSKRIGALRSHCCYENVPAERPGISACSEAMLFAQCLSADDSAGAGLAWHLGAWSPCKGTSVRSCSKVLDATTPTVYYHSIPQKQSKLAVILLLMIPCELTATRSISIPTCSSTQNSSSCTSYAARSRKAPST